MEIKAISGGIGMIILIIFLTIIGIILSKSITKKEGKDIFIYGAVSVVIFLVTGLISFGLYQNSKKEIAENYEIMEAAICEKKITSGSRGGRHYWVNGKTADGHTEWYSVGKTFFGSADMGDTISVYKYKTFYGSSIHSIISQNAGEVYPVFEVVAVISFGIAYIFIVAAIRVKIWYSIKRRRQRSKRKYIIK